MEREFNNLRGFIYILFFSAILISHLHVPENFWGSIFEAENSYPVKKAEFNTKVVIGGLASDQHTNSSIIESISPLSRNSCSQGDSLKIQSAVNNSSAINIPYLRINGQHCIFLKSNMDYSSPDCYNPNSILTTGNSKIETVLKKK